MATFRKRGNGWRVEVRKSGHYLSATFPTKAAATAWATGKEQEILSGKLKVGANNRNVSDAFDRYASTVSPTKKGVRWEQIRLAKLRKNKLAEVKLSELSTIHLSKFRDDRLAEVSAATVNRELNLISAVLTRAKKEWLWLSDNPLRDVERPQQPAPRDRRISEEEIQRLTLALGYVPGNTPCKKSELVGLFFLLAIETAMRLGELCSLRNLSINLSGKYIQLESTKNGDRRQVPLSPQAIEYCRDLLTTELEVSSGSASTLFRKAVKNAAIENLRFHDTRHEAITRLSKKLNVLALARVAGHRDIRSLMIYYNETATELATRLL